MLTLLDRLADLLGGYTRLSCPVCSMRVRFRGVSLTEELRLRDQMAEHLATHELARTANWRCPACDTYNGEQDTACICCDTKRG